VTAEVENKGEVRFWYGLNGLPRIENIGPYSTTYYCFYVDSLGKKIGYAYDIDLDLDKGGAFAKWFPFQIHNLKDLVENYNNILGVVATFPKNPETVPFEDSWGKRTVIKQSNPNFTVKQQSQGKEVWCDLFQ